MAKEFQLQKKNFSDSGTLGFGIQEHTELGIKYNPLVGIYGSTLPQLGFSGIDDISGLSHCSPETRRTSVKT
jgi:hypothetical protein